MQGPHFKGLPSSAAAGCPLHARLLWSACVPHNSEVTCPGRPAVRPQAPHHRNTNPDPHPNPGLLEGEETKAIKQELDLRVEQLLRRICWHVIPDEAKVAKADRSAMGPSAGGGGVPAAAAGLAGPAAAEGDAGGGDVGPTAAAGATKAEVRRGGGGGGSMKEPGGRSLQRRGGVSLTAPMRSRLPSFDVGQLSMVSTQPAGGMNL